MPKLDPRAVPAVDPSDGAVPAVDPSDGAVPAVDPSDGAVPVVDPSADQLVGVNNEIAATEDAINTPMIHGVMDESRRLVTKSKPRATGTFSASVMFDWHYRSARHEAPELLAADPVLARQEHSLLAAEVTRVSRGRMAEAS